MTEQEKINAKIASAELLMMQGYISVKEYLQIIKNERNRDGSHSK